MGSLRFEPRTEQTLAVSLADEAVLTIERERSARSYSWLDLSPASQQRIMQMVEQLGWEHERVISWHTPLGQPFRQHVTDYWWRGDLPPVEVQWARE